MTEVRSPLPGPPFLGETRATAGRLSREFLRILDRVRLFGEHVFGELPFPSYSANSCTMQPRTRKFVRCDKQLANRTHDQPSGTKEDNDMSGTNLTERQQGILDFIDHENRERGYPPSVREIGQAVGLTSPSTVHSHLNTLQKLGYLRRDPSKPRAIEVRYDPNSGAVIERAAVTHVPLVGDVAAGTDVLAHENVEELMPLPTEFTGEGELYMLRVRGTSMINAGIHDGDFVVVSRRDTATNGEIVIAGIPGEEATVKTYTAKGNTVTLLPANDDLEPMVYDASEVKVFGKVVTVLRRY